MDNYSINTYELKINLIQELVRLAKASKLVWKKDDMDIYHGTYKKLKVSVEFYNFQRMDEESSDDTMAVLSIEICNRNPELGLIFDYSIGTEGFELIVKSLSLSFPDWKESWKKNGIKKKIQMLEYMNNL